MKYKIIYDLEIKDGKVILSKEKFEKLLDAAYNDGYADGQKNIITTPYIPSSPSTPYQPYNPWNPIITCETSSCNDSGRPL